MRKVILILGIFGFICPDLFAGKCSPSEASYTSRVRGVCGGRYIPEDKTRDFRGNHLSCSSNVDHFMRRAHPLDDATYREWFKLEQRNDQAGMQKVRREAEPDIEWKGVIPYSVTENWTWTECYYGVNGPVCGYDVTYVTVQVGTDDKGNPIYEQQEIRTPRSCYHDVVRSESLHCSDERMLFEAHFIRPPSQASEVRPSPGLTQADLWNPTTPGYHHVIPNKYDLLPGEMEDVQIFSTSSSSQVSPYVKVGDAWNEYESHIQFKNGSRSMACETSQNPGHQMPYEVRVAIETIKRLIKPTPMAFRLPVDKFGREMDPLGRWEVELNDQNEDIRIKPMQIRLADASSVLIASMARQSRKFNPEIEAAKRKSGMDSNADEEEVREFERSRMEEAAGEEENGFYKDTNVRIFFWETVPLARDIFKVPEFHTDGATAISDKEEDRSDLYRIDLDEFYKPTAPLGLGPVIRLFDTEVELRPRAEYRFEIAMFQEGVPFYIQTGRRKWSKPLEVRFTREKGFDKRSLWDRYRNWRGDPFWRKAYTLFW